MRGQAHILAATADGKAELIIRNDHFHAAGNLVHHHLGDLGRGQRVDDERGRVLDIGNDFDLLALQFTDDSLNPAAAHADAGADRIDPRIVRQNGDLSSASGLAGDSLDLDDAVIDFRHFLGEELGHEFIAGARQENLRAARLFAHIDDIGTHAVALAQVFAGDHLLAADHCLGAAKIDGDGIAFGALDGADNDFADTVLVFFELAGALGVANLLRDHLFCGLRGDPAEFDRRQRLLPVFTDGKGGRLFRTFIRTHLRRVVLDLLDNLDPAFQRDRAAFPVDHRADVAVEPVFGAACLLDGLFHGDHDLFAVDRFFTRHHIGDLDQFKSGNR